MERFLKLGLILILATILVSGAGYSQELLDDLEDQQEPQIECLPPLGGMGPMIGQQRRDRVRDRYLNKIRQEDPGRFKRIQRIEELAFEYRSTENASRKKEIEKQLKTLLDQELRAQQQDSKRKIEELEKRLERMKKLLKEREEKWNEVVDYNFKKVTGQLDYLELRPAPPPRAPAGPPPSAGPKR